MHRGARAAGGGAQAVSAQISGLTAGTTYHFQIVAAERRSRRAAGADATFTTPAAAEGEPVAQPARRRSAAR